MHQLGVLLALALGTVEAATAQEQEVCQDEIRALTTFGDITGSRDPAFRPANQHIEARTFERPGTSLSGYLIRAQTEDGVRTLPKGFVLIMQGNGMLAEHIVDALVIFAQGGLDVFVVDFRGYGSAPPRPALTIRMVADDFEAIMSSLNAEYGKSGNVYAMSAGAVIFLVSDLQSRVERVVLDGVPASINGSPRIRLFGLIPFWGGKLIYDLQCPSAYQPINRLPAKMDNYAIIQGRNDHIVPYKDAEPLLTLAAQRTPNVIVERRWGHPFLGRHGRLERLRVARDFFLTGRITRPVDSPSR